MEPIGEFSGIDIEQMRNVTEHHQTWYVVCPPVIEDRFNRGIKASQSTLFTPIGLGQWEGLLEVVRMEFCLDWSDFIPVRIPS